MNEIPGAFSDPERSAMSALDALDQCRSVVVYLYRSEPEAGPRQNDEENGLDFARYALFDVVVELMGRVEKTLRTFVKERRE